MRTEVALRLNALDTSFYREQAQPFSDTRHAAWPGWRRCLAALGDAPRTLRVLDVAAGNLRFARFLADARPQEQVSYDAVDGCPELMRGGGVPAGWDVRIHERDLVRGLLSGEGDVPSGAETRAVAPSAAHPCAALARGVDLIRYDLVVCFGFAHHVPTAAARERLVRTLCDLTAPGGVCCVSLWRFASDSSLARRARATTAEALPELGLAADDLDEGDWLLGWQGVPHAYRYCHSFADAEVDALAKQHGALLVDRFLSDGRTGELNAYLVWRRL